MDDRICIRRAQSCAADTREAVREFHAAVAQPDMALVVFFCSSDFDLDVLANEMNRLFAGVRVVGCTTAGEIGPAGYIDHSLNGASFPRNQFSAVSGCIENLTGFRIPDGQNFTRTLLDEQACQPSPANTTGSVAFLLIDGLSVREEPVTRALQSTLGKMPLVGGSAGDGAHFQRTWIYADGHFGTDRAVLILLTTNLPLKVFKTHNFVATNERLVVTEADPHNRVVREINGLPAAQEYARILGVEVEDLTPRHFANWSFVVLIDGVSYVRSIQKVNPDGSLTLFCAIENGLVLRITKSVGLLENLEQTLADVEAEIGAPQLILGGDCVHRKLEIEQSADKDRVASVLMKNKVTGFNTYGEQFRGVHINQTFVGVAFGEAAEPGHA